MKSKKINKTFEEHLKAAKDIVGKLESGDCSLDEMLRLYEEGVESLKICSKKPLIIKIRPIPKLNVLLISAIGTFPFFIIN